MESLFKNIIAGLGEDLTRPGLQRTPKRAAAAWQFLTQGYAMNLADIVNDALFPSPSDDMIIVQNIELYSICEHHLLPFIGKCHVAYLPDQQVIGLSKIARLVNMYARRLQIQENLTKQIADTLCAVTQAKGVGVIIEAQHLCMMMRGVSKQNASMTTSVMLGCLREDHAIKADFLNLLNKR